MKQILVLSFFFLHLSLMNGQSNTSVLYQKIHQLAESRTVMYIAAHPDDENTRLISWLTNAQHLNTVYLSLTRGDGGQNLIGTEKGELLGLLRTQELLEARKIDGGKQWFTRANDFGYSKTATETLSIWDEEQILGDVVWAIRKHQPDVLITRFDPKSNGKTHGHHTTSAILAEKAFELAGDKTAYPEQLEFVEIWQPRRLFFNTSWWFYGSKEKFEKADKSKMISMDVGEYYPLLGRSNNEIASSSRSKHACQGFGSALQRGSHIEWLELLKGDIPLTNNLLDEIPNRLPAQLKVNARQILNNFDFKDPSKSSSDLVAFKNELLATKNEQLIAQKLPLVQDLILKANGIYLEWVTSEEYGVEGQKMKTTLEVTNRSSKTISIEGKQLGVYKSIGENQKYTKEIDFHIPLGANRNSPYWLNESMPNIGIYTVENQEQIGQPESADSIVEMIQFEINGQALNVPIGLKHKHVNPAKGEVYEPFYIVPRAAVTIPEPVYIFTNNEPQTIRVEVAGFMDNVKGTVALRAKNWTIEEAKDFEISTRGNRQIIEFKVTPPVEQTVDELKAFITLNGKQYKNSFQTVNYDHIDKQFVFQPAHAKIEKINLNVPDVNVAYIMGSGDLMPQSLRQVGLQVDELEEENWTLEAIQHYDVVLIGIRAFNKHKKMQTFKANLWKYVEQGGVVLTQYQTNRRLKPISPVSLKLGRDRISEEDAALTILQPSHSVFQRPNKITTDDFENWVQERGLYFGKEWDSTFVPLLRGHDANENDKDGALLVAQYGEGYYVYTGISFFRQLPAGVPGAYRLFMNLLNLAERKE